MGVSSCYLRKHLNESHSKSADIMHAFASFECTLRATLNANPVLVYSKIFGLPADEMV